jgi:hypothetical protein
VTPVLVALIFVLGTIVTPLLVARQANKRQDAVAQRAAEAALALREHDDQVAAQAAEAAALLLERQDEAAAHAAEAARLLVESNERVALAAADADARTQGALREIHTLVNSNLTAAKQNELVATEALLLAKREVARLNRRAGLVIDPELVAEIDEIENRLVDMRVSLAERLAATVVAAQQKDQAQP